MCVAQAKIPTAAISLDAQLANRRRRAFRSFVARHTSEIGNIKRWALMAGLPNANGIYNFLRGRTDSLSTVTLDKLASVLPGVSIEDLMPDRNADPRALHLPVNIPAARDRWRSALTTFLPAAAGIGMPVPPGVEAHMAVHVEDDHAAHLGVPEGAIALVRDLATQPHRIAPGMLVLIRRVRGAPARLETTIHRVPSDATSVAPSTAGAAVVARGQRSGITERVDVLGSIAWVGFAPSPCADNL